MGGSPQLYLLCLLGLGSAAVGFAQPTPREAFEEASRAFSGTQSPEVLARWQTYEQEIARETARQDAAVQQGGTALDECISRYETLAEIQGTPVNHYLAGRILGLAGRLDQARAFFDSSIAIDRTFYWGHQGLATYYAMRGQLEPASKSYQRCLELNPNFTKATRGMAMCEMQLRNYPRAEVLFRRILETDPNDSEARISLSQMLLLDNRPAEAANELLALKQRASTGVEVDRLLGRCYARMGESAKAVALYENILNSAQDDWRSALELGRILMEAGENHRAADRMDQCLDHMPLQSPVNREELQKAVDYLRGLPPKSDPAASGTSRTPEDYLHDLQASAEPEKRRAALRVLAASPYRPPELQIAVMRALKDKDSVVRTLAVRTLGDWMTDAEQLGDKQIVKILGLLLNDEKHVVRGMVATVLGKCDHPRAVPPLIRRLERERDAYVFGQIHRALNHLTFAYLEVPLEGTLDVARMDDLARQWRTWYDRNSLLFRKYEEE